MSNYIMDRGGHTKACCGAVDAMNEQVECLALLNRINQLLREVGDTVVDATPPQTLGYGDELNYGVNLANRADFVNKISYFMSIHMNSLKGKDPRGSEVLVYPGTSITTEVGNRILNNLHALGFENRGIKDGRGNSEIDDIKKPSMIVEVCFVQPSDTTLYKKVGMERVARAIANGVNPNVKLIEPSPVKMYRNIIIYNDGAEADRWCAEFFKMILQNANEDCECVSYSEYRKNLVDGRSIFAVGGSLTGKFKYHKLFSGTNRNETAHAMLEHLKKY